MAVTTDNYIYARLLKKAADQRILPNKSKEARDWFRANAQKYNGPRINQGRLFQDSKIRSNITPGSMYMYVYDAKTKDKLPYWDAFPVIFPVSTFSGGFTGLNLHYLHPAMRARLMDGLYNITNNSKYDDTTKIKISYEALKGAAGLKLFQPCFKKYLYSHVKSQFIYIEPKEWDIAMFLPLHKFQGATAEEVWRDSASGEQPWQKWKTKGRGTR